MLDVGARKLEVFVNDESKGDMVCKGMVYPDQLARVKTMWGGLRWAVKLNDKSVVSVDGPLDDRWRPIV